MRRKRQSPFEQAPGPLDLRTFREFDIQQSDFGQYDLRQFDLRQSDIQQVDVSYLEIHYQGPSLDALDVDFQNSLSLIRLTLIITHD